MLFIKKGFLNVKNIKKSKFLMLKQNLVNEAISFSNNLENFAYNLGERFTVLVQISNC